jgi:hypothetical protein
MSEIDKMSNINKLIDQFRQAHEQNLCVLHYHTSDYGCGVLVIDVPAQKSDTIPELVQHVKNTYTQVNRVNTYAFLDFVRIGFWYDNH